MNFVELSTYQLRMLQTLLSNRIHDLDLVIASPEHYAKYGDMAGTVKTADVAYRVDLQNLYTKLDSVDPI